MKEEKERKERKRHCKDCGKEISIIGYDVRCAKCKRKNTEHRKYQRRHIHRLKLAGLYHGST